MICKKAHASDLGFQDDVHLQIEPRVFVAIYTHLVMAKTTHGCCMNNQQEKENEKKKKYLGLLEKPEGEKQKSRLIFLFFLFFFLLK